MTVQDVQRLPMAQKLQIMTAIWEDLRGRFDQLELSQEQKDLLDDRRARVRDGTSRLVDWDAVKSTLGRT